MKYFRQLGVILLVSFLAECMEFLIPLPVSASVYGLALMLAGLTSRVIPLEKVEGAADYLVGIMTLFFLPPTVGIMASAEELREMAVPLAVICAVSTPLVMAVAGRVAQALIRRGEKR